MQILRGGADPRKNRAKRDPVFFCPRCKARDEVETGMVVEVRIAPVYKGAKLTGGERRRICLYCLLAGEVNYVD